MRSFVLLLLAGLAAITIIPLLKAGNAATKLLIDLAGIKISKGKKLTEIIATITLQFRNPTTQKISIQFIYLDIYVGGVIIAQTKQGSPGQTFMEIAPGTSNKLFSANISI